MKVIVGEHAGFCFGVKRAVEMTEKEAAEFCGGYTLGPIVHNEEVIKDFETKGVSSISLDEALKLAPTRIIIRAHGVGRAVYEALEEKGHEVLDATCPFVKKIHKTVDEYSAKGYFIIVLGDANHPEVQGIVGWINGDDYTVINSHKEAEDFRLKSDKQVCIVSQTTLNNNKFKEYIEILDKKGYDVVALDTICSATYKRQRETEEIASKVDAMIVIGGRDSSNSRKLFEIAKGNCKSYFIQTKSDLDSSQLYSIETVGITAGASTPDNIIREVISECQK